MSQFPPQMPPSSPHPQQPVPPHAPVAARQPRGGLPWILGVAGVVLGAVLGLVAGWLVFADRDSESAAPGDFDAAMTCRILQRVPDDWPDRLAIDEPSTYRIQAAGASAMAAGHGNPKYAGWQEHGENLWTSLTRLEPEVGQEVIAELLAECEQHGLLP